MYIQYSSASSLNADKEYLLDIIKPGDIIQHINSSDEAGHRMFVYEVTDNNIFYCQHTYNLPTSFEDLEAEENQRRSLFGDDGIVDRYSNSSDNFSFIIINNEVL